MSYLFWQTMPDDELFARARSGALLNPEVMQQQVQRLLADPRSIAMANDFVSRWLHIDQLMVVIRDAEIYAALYFELRDSMLKETAFLVEELWRDNRSFTELFTSESSWLDDKLATYYGIERNPQADGAEVNDDGFLKVRVEDTRPGGVLTHGAFLTTHASATTSSPINVELSFRKG